MSPFSSEESTRIEIRGQKILIAALAIGQLFFAAIALVVQWNREETKSFTTSYVLAALGAMMFPAAWIYGNTIAKKQRERIATGTWTENSPAAIATSTSPATTDGDRLLRVWRAKSLGEGSFVQAAAFMALIAYITEGQLWVLAVAAFSLMILLVRFPTYERAESWVLQQLDLMEIEKRHA